MLLALFFNYCIMDITKELLLSKGFMTSFDECSLKEIYPDYFSVEKEVNNFFITVHTLSNYYKRNFCVHIDNKDRDTIAIIDIQTTEHFNKIMDILDINYAI